MLILTRKNQESIMIGDDIKVKILGVKGGVVRVAIDAPKKIAVHREEVYKRIKSEEKEEKEVKRSALNP